MLYCMKFLRELWNLAGDVQNWHVNQKAPFKFQQFWSREMQNDCKSVSPFELGMLTPMVNVVRQV